MYQTAAKKTIFDDIHADYFKIKDSKNDRKISFLQNMVSKTSSIESLEQSELVLTKARILFDKLKTNKVPVKKYPETITKIDELTILISKFNGIMNGYELDDSISQKIHENLLDFLKVVKSMKALILEYVEIQEAVKQIKDGDTLTIEQVFHEP